MSSTRALTSFQQALLDSVLREYGEVPGEKELPNCFSQEFCQWADTYMARRKGRSLSTATKILIAAIIILLLAGTAMAIPVIREAVIDFFLHEYEDRISITFDPEVAAAAPEIIEVPFGLSYVPEGYTLAFEQVQQTFVINWWESSNDRWISFIQYPIPNDPNNGDWLGLNAEGAVRETVRMKDYAVERISTRDNIKLIWTDNTYLFILELPLAISEGDMQAIFAGWSVAE